MTQTRAGSNEGVGGEDGSQTSEVTASSYTAKGEQRGWAVEEVFSFLVLR